MARDARPSGRSTAGRRPAARRGPEARRPANRSAAGRTPRPTRRGVAGTLRSFRAHQSPRSMRRLTVLGALVLFLAVLITPTLRSYLAQRNQIDSLRNQVYSQRKDVAAKQAQKKKWSDPPYITEQARNRLGFVKPGQTLTIVVNDNGSTSAGSSAEAKPTSQQPWYGQVWNSVGGVAAQKSGSGR